MSTQWTQRIEINPRILVGKPVIKGTRISVELILEELARGATHEYLIREYDLTEEDIQAALLYARDSVAGEQVFEERVAAGK
jgi:uncharacterized protein (DUF433 family)